MKNHLRQQLGGRLWGLVLLLLLPLAGTLIWRVPAALAQLDRVVIAVTITPPFILEDEDGALTGFDIDLINALAAKADLQIVYTKTDFRYLLPGVTTHLYDVGSACITITPERQAQVYFTRPYFATGLTLVVPTAITTTTSVADLTPELTVGVLDGSASAAFAHTLNTAVVHPILNIEDVFAKVEAGELNAAISTEANFLGYQLSHPNASLKMVGGLLTYSECGLAINQADTTLSAQLDGALTEIKSDGTYDTIYQKWFGARALPEKPIESTPTVDAALPSPTPLPNTAVVSSSITSTAALAGIYYLTVNADAAPAQDDQAVPRYQILTLVENGFWFVSEAPPLVADSNTLPDAPTGQPGLWFVNARGEVEAMLLTFSAPLADTGAADVIRKDYAMQVASDGTVVGTYYTTHYAADLFALPSAPTAVITQTIEFTGQRMQ